jgi:hypothetical protein
LLDAVAIVGSEAHLEADRLINHWHNLISYVIKKDVDVLNERVNSVLDELLMLSQLLKEDLITKDECELQKKSIVNHT